MNASPTTAVTTHHRAVGLLINAPPENVAPVARELARRRLNASFALSSAPSPHDLGALHRKGDDAIPRLDVGGPFHSLGTKGRLVNDATALGLGKGFMYEPSSDFTPTQYLLAHAAGGSPFSAPPRAARAIPFRRYTEVRSCRSTSTGRGSPGTRPWTRCTTALRRGNSMP